MRCPSCSAVELVSETRDLSHRHRGEVTVILAVKGQFCSGCGEAFFDKGTADRISAAMAAFNKRIDARYALN
jgi:HTH-type transcriptional regulator / antitoxin MqsA